MVTKAHQIASPKLTIVAPGALRSASSSASAANQMTIAAGEGSVEGDVAAQLVSARELATLGDPDGAKEAQRTQRRQEHDQEVDDMGAEPAASLLGDPEARQVVDDEDEPREEEDDDGPGAVREGRIGDDLPRVGQHERDRGDEERPVRDVLPALGGDPLGDHASHSTVSDVSAHSLEHAGPSPARLLVLSLPAALVGLVSGLVLWLLDAIAHEAQHALWDTVPHAWGLDPASPWWILGVLTAIGVLVGLVLQFVPGRGGRDSATVELIAPPQPLSAVPSIVLAVLLTLAGGVSLGPESPIIAINTALAVWGLTRLWKDFPIELAVVLTAAGTIGALFGTPVAAALVFTGALAAKPGGSLWDKLFLPLVSASAGAIVTVALGGGMGSVTAIEPYANGQAIDVLWAMLVAAGAALVGLVAVVLLPVAHRLFHGMRWPLLTATVGGLVLGILGALGGPSRSSRGCSRARNWSRRRRE